MRVRLVDPPDFAYAFLGIPAIVLAIMVVMAFIESCGTAFTGHRAPPSSGTPAGLIAQWGAIIGGIGACVWARLSRRLESGEVGIYMVKKVPQQKLLSPGWNYVGADAKAYAIPLQPEGKSFTQLVFIPDGSEWKVTVYYAFAPDIGQNNNTMAVALFGDTTSRPLSDAEKLWRVYEYADQLDSMVEHAVRERLSSFCASKTEGPQRWTEMASANTEIAQAIAGVNIANYGLRFTAASVSEIQRAGAFADEDPRERVKELPGALDVQEPRNVIETMKQLKAEEKKLLEENKDDPDIQEAIRNQYRRRYAKLKEP